MDRGPHGDAFDAGFAVGRLVRRHESRLHRLTAQLVRSHPGEPLNEEAATG